jgi:hypothetical protein
MKNLILALAASLMTSQAHADVLKAGLNTFNMQPQSLLFVEPVGQGSVEVDTTAKTISLHVGAHYFAEVPLKRVNTDECGTVVYSGEDGMVIADGFYTQIRVTDNSKSTCSVSPFATEVRLQVSGGFAGINEIHHMGGNIALAGIVSANLNRFDFQSGSLFASEDINTGSVKVDRTAKTIQLILQPAFKCLPGVVCPEMMRAPIEITLPLEQVIAGRCAVTYESKTAYPAQGGLPLSSLTVSDYSSGRCPNIRPAAEVVVSLGIHGFITETHTMYGSKN